MVVYDRLRDTLHLMVDTGLNKVAKSLHYYTLVTHVMDFKDFLVTTGASTPVPIHTESGLKVQRRFEAYLRLVNNGRVLLKRKSNILPIFIRFVFMRILQVKFLLPWFLSVRKN